MSICTVHLEITKLYQNVLEKDHTRRRSTGKYWKRPYLPLNQQPNWREIKFVKAQDSVDVQLTKPSWRVNTYWLLENNIL